MISILMLNRKVIVFHSASNASELNYTSSQCIPNGVLQLIEICKQIKYLNSLYNKDCIKTFTETF